MSRKKRAVWMGMLVFLLCGALFSGCGGNQMTDTEDATVIYYINNSETGVERQPYEIRAVDTKTQIEELIEQLGILPDKLEYKAPLQMGFTILSYRIDGETLYLDVDEGYRKLKATTEVLVRAALVRTFSQADNIRYVAFTVAGEPLYDTLGSPIGLMAAEHFIDNAGNEINAYEKVRLKLYFANAQGDALVATTRTVVYNTNISLEKLVVEELLKGPGAETAGEMLGTINPDTKIITVIVKDNVCYVNFNETFLTQTYTVTPEVAIYSIVNSLVELTGVNKVQITINGNTDLMYRESISLSTVFERNLELIAATK